LSNRAILGKRVTEKRATGTRKAVGTTGGDRWRSIGRRDSGRRRESSWSGGAAERDRRPVFRRTLFSDDWLRLARFGESAAAAETATAAAAGTGSGKAAASSVGLRHGLGFQPRTPKRCRAHESWVLRDSEPGAALVMVLWCTGLPSRSALAAPPLRLAALRWRKAFVVLGRLRPPPGVSSGFSVSRVREPGTD
jgi:hypothetical protein